MKKQIIRSVLATIFLMGLHTLDSSAYCVYNNSQQKINFKISALGWESGNLSFDGSKCWNYRDFGNGSRTKEYTVEVQSNGIQFNCVISMQAGGYIKVFDHLEENGVKKTLSVTSYTFDHNVLQKLPAVSSPGNRHVEFLATADPQFIKGNIEEKNLKWQQAATVLTKLKTEVASNSNKRGIIVAGDLTAWSRTMEFQEYEKFTSGYHRYLYDGLGNHDFEDGNCCNGSGSLRGGNFLAWNDACICPSEIAQAIGDRKRSTPLAMRMGPNYSWDWHDVHFVQLNLFPGNGIKDGKYNTYNSLMFLITDLAVNVGNSGRPVVLVHHYGFEGFSRGACSNDEKNTDIDGCGGSGDVWWTQEERKAYWNAIANYNVPLIVTGHLHNTGGSDWWKTKWKRPAGLTNGPSEIQTITAGGAKDGGYYCSFTMNNNSIQVERFQFDKIEMKNFIPTSKFNHVAALSIPITKPGDKPAHLTIEAPTPVTGFKRIQNRWKTDQYLHIEHGPIKSAPLGAPGWWSAQWELVPVSGTNFVQIRNRWKPNVYLHIEKGSIEAGPLGKPDWWSAQWELVTVQGAPYKQIRNRWKPNIYLHNQNGAIEAGPLGAPGWWSAQWKVE